MDDFQLIIYIAFLVLYFLTRGLTKKKGKRSPRRGQQPAQPKEEPTRTFDELLRELSGEKKPEPPPPPKPEFGFEGDYPSDEEIEGIYKESVNEASKVKTLDEMVDLSAKESIFKAYETEEKEDVEANEFVSEIRSILLDPNQAKKAIVLREILDRKHF